MTVAELVTSIDNFVWGLPLVIFSLICGLLFTVVLKCPQIRLFKQMLRCSFPKKKAGSGMTAFQALSIAIGGRVGTGNITGTASAILFGGPGSIFWMCVMALICSASAYPDSQSISYSKIKQCQDLHMLKILTLLLKMRGAFTTTDSSSVLLFPPQPGAKVQTALPVFVLSAFAQQTYF